MQDNLVEFNKYFNLCKQHKGFLEKLMALKLGHYMLHSSREMGRLALKESWAKQFNAFKESHKLNDTAALEIIILGGMLEAILADPKALQ